MFHTLTISLLVLAGASGSSAYVSGAPDSLTACPQNAAPLAFPFQTFHGMPDVPDQHIPSHCLFPWLDGRPLHGSFHFGFSEMEYSQHWFTDAHGRVLTMREAGAFGGEDGGQWVIEHTPGKGAFALKGHEVWLGQKLVGYLVYMEVAGSRHLGWVDLSTQNSGSVEIGFFTPYEKKLPGQMPQASRVILTSDYLKRFSKAELKLMRNEIFARHGHRFKAGGAMEKHFQAQSWYQKLPAPQKPIQSLLSKVEKENISLIQKAEKR